MGSLSVLKEALGNIETYCASILTNTSNPVSASFDSTSIVTNLQTVNTSVGLVKSALDSMDAALLGAIQISNTDLLSVISNLGTLNASIASMSTAIQNAITSKNQILGYTTATKSVIATGSIPAATSVLLFAANPSRKGFTIYNNSTNSLYVCIENPAVAANLIDFCGSNAGPTSVVKWSGPGVPTQAIYVIRNAGTGNVTGWEFS